MNTILSILFLILVCLLLPAIFLGWLTESRTERIRRMKRQGLSQRRIAERLGVSRWTVRRALVGA